MADVHTKEIRSINRAAIKGKNSRLEMPCGDIYFYMPMATRISGFLKFDAINSDKAVEHSIK